MNVGWHPSGIAVNYNTNRIYVVNRDDFTVSVIDGATNSVVATVRLPSGGWPEGVDVNTDTNLIYVVNNYGNSVSVIDGVTNSVVATVGVGTYPTSVAVKPSTNLVYASNLCSGTVSVINGATSMVVATVDFGAGSGPFGVAVNPVTNRTYVANYGWPGTGNTVSVIDGVTQTVVATVNVESDPQNVAVNPSTNRIYVVHPWIDAVSVIQDGGFSTATDVSSSLNPSTYGQSVTFTASVNPVLDGGTVQFKIDGADFGTPVTLSGGSASSAAISTLSVGNHTVTATYSGDTNFNSSTSPPLTQTVNKAALTVAANDASRLYGAPNPAFRGTINGISER